MAEAGAGVMTLHHLTIINRLISLHRQLDGQIRHHEVRRAGDQVSGPELWAVLQLGIWLATGEPELSSPIEMRAGEGWEILGQVVGSGGTEVKAVHGGVGGLATRDLLRRRHRDTRVRDLDQRAGGRLFTSALG